MFGRLYACSWSNYVYCVGVADIVFGLPLFTQAIIHLGWAPMMNLMNSSGNVRAYICGHVHQRHESEIGNLLFLTAPSTCFQFEPASNRFAVAEDGPGYRWLELSPDGSIKTEVVHVPSNEAALDLESGKK